MSAICLCGVCVPYSAILPLLLIVVQVIAKPLHAMGLLPDFIALKLGLPIKEVVRDDNEGTDEGDDGCCDAKECTNSSTTSTESNSNHEQIDNSTILEISSLQELHIYAITVH